MVTFNQHFVVSGTIEVRFPTGDGGPASSAGLDGYGLHMTFDLNGNMYSSSAYTIRLTRGNTQIISTVAGSLLGYNFFVVCCIQLDSL